MSKWTLFAALALALAGCNPVAQRAPAHPSQSQATAPGVTQQVQISAANRAEVENNIRNLLTQTATQYAAGAVAIPGMADVLTAIQPGSDHQTRVALTGGTATCSSAPAMSIATMSISNCSTPPPARWSDPI